MAFSLRDYQEDAVVSVRQEFRNGRRYVLVVLATGAGKTVIFSYIARGAAEKGNKVLILAHRDQLIKQASHKLRDYGVLHGIIMPGFTPNPLARVQVGSIQTVVRRLNAIEVKRLAMADKARAAAQAKGRTEEEAEAEALKAKHSGDPSLIIIDEAHLSAAATYRKILDFYPTSRVLGVTGSPCRLDNKPLGRTVGGIYDAMVRGISIGQLISRGFLVKPEVYAPANRLDLSGLRKTAGEYNAKDAEALMDKPKITGDAVEMYRTICPGVPAVAWCVSIGHAEHVAAEFNAAGIPAMMLCGDHDSDARDKALKDLELGRIKVITFVGILIEGVDCPAIEAILLLRPTMSLASYLQVIGRGLRPFTNRLGRTKTCCYVLDHCGLTYKHGFADDEDREWSLEEGEVRAGGKKKGSKAPRVESMQCKKCYRMFNPAPACPGCGHPVEIIQRKVEVEDGVLQKVTPEMAEAIRRRRQGEVRSARSLADLEKIAAERGYSPKWAEHTWGAKQKARRKYSRSPAPVAVGAPPAWATENLFPPLPDASGGN